MDGQTGQKQCLPLEGDIIIYKKMIHLHKKKSIITHKTMKVCGTSEFLHKNPWQFVVQSFYISYFSVIWSCGLAFFNDHDFLCLKNMKYFVLTCKTFLGLQIYMQIYLCQVQITLTYTTSCNNHFSTVSSKFIHFDIKIILEHLCPSYQCWSTVDSCYLEHT